MQTIADISLTPTELMALTKAMLAVASVDAMVPAEAALIGQFYESSRSADMPTTLSVLSGSQAFEPHELAGCTDDVADALILMSLMAGYADGRLSAAELALVRGFATSLKLSDDRFDALLGRVRDELIGSLSHLPDAPSVAKVLRSL